MEQITCKNLAIGYDGKVLLKDINFSVKSGDYSLSLHRTDLPLSLRISRKGFCPD